MDIRLETEWVDHPKTLHLVSQVGPQGALCLLRLWCWASLQRHRGDLSGLSDHDIERAAGWRGKAGAWVKAASSHLPGKAGWLDGPEGSRSLHDWAVHQPYVYNRSSRTEQARMAARSRWDRLADHARRNAISNPISIADSIAKRTENDARSIDSRMLKHADVSCSAQNEHCSTDAAAGLNADRNAPAPVPVPVPPEERTPPTPSLDPVRRASAGASRGPSNPALSRPSLRPDPESDPNKSRARTSRGGGFKPLGQAGAAGGNGRGWHNPEDATVAEQAIETIRQQLRRTKPGPVDVAGTSPGPALEVALEVDGPTPESVPSSSPDSDPWN